MSDPFRQFLNEAHARILFLYFYLFCKFFNKKSWFCRTPLYFSVFDILLCFNKLFVQFPFHSVLLYNIIEMFSSGISKKHTTCLSKNTLLGAHILSFEIRVFLSAHTTFSPFSVPPPIEHNKTPIPKFYNLISLSLPIRAPVLSVVLDSAPNTITVPRSPYVRCIGYNTIRDLTPDGI